LKREDECGWLVSPLDFDQFDELYDFRVLIECFAVRHLCEAEDRSGLVFWPGAGPQSVVGDVRV